jgi:hypothetical protein
MDIGEKNCNYCEDVADHTCDYLVWKQVSEEGVVL